MNNREQFEAMAKEAGMWNYNGNNADNDTLLDLMQKAYDMPRWVAVSNWKDVPDGKWLAFVDGNRVSSGWQNMSKKGDLCTIGSIFAWDAGNVIAYQPLPSPPTTQK